MKELFPRKLKKGLQSKTGTDRSSLLLVYSARGAKRVRKDRSPDTEIMYFRVNTLRIFSK